MTKLLAMLEPFMREASRIPRALFIHSFGWETWRKSAVTEANKQQLMVAFMYMVREIGVQVMKFSEN